jgi:menaquinone-dependent protoporphyrinogen oxidase
MGGTAGIAEMIRAEMALEGIDAEVRPAAEVKDVAPHDAVIVGGALYAARWHRQAARLVKRREKALRQKAVWMFSSGPLDESAKEKTVPPVRGVQKLLDRVGARGHATFGGAMPAEPEGFIARAMAKKLTGDWRDRDQIAAWAHHIVDELKAEAAVEVKV